MLCPELSVDSVHLLLCVQDPVTVDGVHPTLCVQDPVTVHSVLALQFQTYSPGTISPSSYLQDVPMGEDSKAHLLLEKC